MVDYPCPFCPCIFVSKSDLQLHLDAFGSNAVLHGRKFRCVNRDIEFTLSSVHGSLDRIVRDFERIILDYVKDCKKFGKKVCILE